jgi:hypothetical protein
MYKLPITVAARSKAWIVFVRSLERWDRGFKSHSKHGCLCGFILCLCCPVYVAVLRRADHSSKETYRLCKNDDETEKKPGPNKGL